MGNTQIISTSLSSNSYRYDPFVMTVSLLALLLRFTAPAEQLLEVGRLQPSSRLATEVGGLLHGEGGHLEQTLSQLRGLQRYQGASVEAVAASNAKRNDVAATRG